MRVPYIIVHQESVTLKSCKNDFRLLMIQSSHSFAHITAAELSWYVQSYDLIQSLVFTVKQHELSDDLDCEFMNH